MKKINLKINPSKLVRIVENHGGYLTAECIVCDASGWLGGKLGYASIDKNAPGNHLKHKKNCPLNKIIKT